MENIEKISSYQLSKLSMTIDTESDKLSGYSLACNNCQCNCQQCFGCQNGKFESMYNSDKLSEKEKEEALEKLFI